MRRAGAYDELEFAVDARLFYVIYRLAQTSTFAVTSSCFGDAYDSVMAAVTSETDERAVDAVTRAWPLWTQLALKGQNSDFAQAALFRAVDPDDGMRKWFVGTESRNVAPIVDRIPEDVALEIARVISVSLELLREWAANRLDESVNPADTPGTATMLRLISCAAVVDSRLSDR